MGEQVEIREDWEGRIGYLDDPTREIAVGHPSRFSIERRRRGKRRRRTTGGDEWRRRWSREKAPKTVWRGLFVLPKERPLSEDATRTSGILVPWLFIFLMYPHLHTHKKRKPLISRTYIICIHVLIIKIYQIIIWLFVT